jgi:diguanylate cyclase (GGDEF)-like protein
MKPYNTPVSPGREGGNILLAGDISSAFLDAGAISEPLCQIHSSMTDAIDAAAKSSFTAIAIVVSGMSNRLSSSLKALREANPDTKIILLAQMHEEPTAAQLIGTICDGQSLADDYLICPIRFSYLVSRVSCLAGDTDSVSRDAFGRGESAVSAAVDDKREAKIRQLEKLATEDDLTGLKNRRYVWEFSRQIIEQAKKENGRVTLLVFDIDNLKHYNDVYGHSAGDEVLRQAAVLMRRCCRSHDVVARIGGDEFAVIFWDVSQQKTADAKTERRSALADHPTEAIFIAKRIRMELEKAELNSLGPAGKGVLTISGGLASFPRDGLTIQQLFAQADKALLDAKRSGKNRIYLVGRPESDIADMDDWTVQRSLSDHLTD